MPKKKKRKSSELHQTRYHPAYGYRVPIRAEHTGSEDTQTRLFETRSPSDDSLVISRVVQRWLKEDAAPKRSEGKTKSVARKPWKQKRGKRTGKRRRRVDPWADMKVVRTPRLATMATKAAADPEKAMSSVCGGK